MSAYLQHEAIFNIEQDFSRVSVVPDKNMKGVTLLHPTHESNVRSQRNDGVPLNVKSAFETVRVNREESVDQAEQLHYSFILTQILVTYGILSEIVAHSQGKSK